MMPMQSRSPSPVCLGDKHSAMLTSILCFFLYSSAAFFSCTILLLGFFLYSSAAVFSCTALLHSLLTITGNQKYTLVLCFVLCLFSSDWYSTCSLVVYAYPTNALLSFIAQMTAAISGKVCASYIVGNLNHVRKSHCRHQFLVRLP